MKPPNDRAESLSSTTDPIATIRLWTVLPLLFVVTLIVGAFLGRSPAPELERAVHMVAGFVAVIVWWWDVVAGATRRAGFCPTASSIGGVFKLSSKVALGVILTKLVWLLFEHASGLPRLGLVTEPRLVVSETPVQAFAFDVFLGVLLGPVAEEMLFRGALFRKWRLRLGPGKALLLTSVLFGLMHVSAPTAALSALSLCVLYTATRTLWAPMVAHALNNLFAVTLSHAVPLLPLAVLQAATDWRLQLAFLVPGLLGTWWLVRFLRREWHTLGDPVHGGAPLPAAVIAAS